MTELVRNRSVEPQRRSALLEVAREDLHEAGTYVEVGSSDLHPLPQEALIAVEQEPVPNDDASSSDDMYA